MTRTDQAALARIAGEVAAVWNLTLGPPFPMALRSYVATAGDDAVLKVTPVEDDDADHEADALALWGGDGAVRLLRHDPERRALLLERLHPGTDLASSSDDEATRIAVDVGRRLWRPADEPFRRVGDQIDRWLDDAPSGNATRRTLVSLARELWDGFRMGRETLVHGDFHHHNLLLSGAIYVAIDPKPMLGEPEFDVPPFLWNPVGSVMRRDVTERRIAAFADAGLDDQRIRAWTVIRGAVLGAGDPEVILRLVG